MAAKQNGEDTIEADLRDGGRIDALKYALSANSLHGHRRTREDIKRCVEIALREFPKLSNVQIAKICGVAASTVLRNREEPSVQCTDAPATRITSDGRQYPAHINQPARDPEPPAEYQEGWQESTTTEPESPEIDPPKKYRVIDSGKARDYAEYSIRQIDRINLAVDKDRYEAYIMIIKKIIDKTKNDTEENCKTLGKALNQIISG
jgi:hypothetical protein